MGDLAQRVIQDWERDEADRGTWKTHCQEVADYTLPDRNDYIVERTPGEKRMTKIFDSTPIFAQDMFAGGMHSLLTSPWMQFANLWTEDNRLNNDGEVIDWCQDASEAMFRIFSATRYGFAPASHELYLDQASIGTACMSVLEPRGNIRFATRHMKECTIRENEEDRIDQLTRNWKWTPKQAVEEWGQETLKAAGADTLLKAYVDGKTEKFQFLHSVKPRRKFDAQRRDKRNKPFESVYVSVSDKAEIEIGGFDEFPYLVPRLSKVSGEVYGRGLGMLELPDIKMLNKMVTTVLKAAQKVIDPPLQVPDDGFLVPIKTVPGAMNYYRANSVGRIEPIKTEGQISIGVEIINALKQQILRGYYVEWMIMPSDPKDPAAAGKGVTATYVLQQRDEKMRLLAPLLARLQSEFLGPLIDRVFAIMWRRSVMLRFGPGSPFKQPPPQLRGVPLRVEYVSPIALAQKSSQMDAVTRVLQLQEQLRQMDPQGQLIIDSEFMMRLAGKDWNAPAGILKTPEALQQEREQAQQATQAQQQQEAIAGLAGAAKDGAGAVKGLADAHAAASGGGQMRQAA